jgi:RNA polymerase sigma-70 factor (ECF subfamily)
MEAAMPLERATALTDEDLARSAAAGDQLAYASLVERYRRLAFATAYAMLRSREDAEDIAQEAFVRAYRALPSYDSRRPWAAWLLCIVRNLCRDAVRRSAVRAAHASSRSESGDAEPPPSPEAMMLASERASALQAAVNALPEHLRTPIVLHYAYGHTYREIAVALGLRESTVVGRLAAAMRRLRRRLAPEVLT